jgi:hypothetical protein
MRAESCNGFILQLQTDGVLAAPRKKLPATDRLIVLSFPLPDWVNRLGLHYSRSSDFLIEKWAVTVPQLKHGFPPNILEASSFYLLSRCPIFQLIGSIKGCSFEDLPDALNYNPFDLI